MNLTRAFTFSLVLHAILFGVLASGISIPWPKPEINPLPIQARLVVKKKRDENLLPKREHLVLPEEKQTQEEVKPVEPTPTPPEPEKKVAELKKLEQAPVPKIGMEKVAANDKAKPTQKPTKDFAKQLAAITKNFAKDVDTPKKELFDPDADAADSVSYFDQVYALIKESFVVPPHINGPEGQKLQAVVRIFLAADGTLTKLDLESSSGDEHFDKAVMDGTRRVNNFGAVPIFLQTALRERGIVVELCPFKCAKS